MSGSIRKHKLLLLLLLVVTIIISIYFFINKAKPTVLGTSTEQLSLASAKTSASLNKEFLFPILNEKNVEVTKIKYTLTTVEKQSEIIVAGQKATSVKGKIFLIVNLKLTNDYSKNISINTRDYIRLTVNNNDQEQIAPEIHNDPVEVLAISTKYTRVGFTINDTDQNLVLKVGEINKDKTAIPLSFNQ